MVIIGGSLAGSATALHLAQAGISSVILDRAEFPRRKACGEGLSLVGLRRLEELGVADQILALPHAPYRGIAIWAGGPPVRLRLGDEGECKGIGIQRYVLDQCLQSAALASGLVTGLFGEPVQEAQLLEDECRVRAGEREIAGKLLVLADGAASRFREAWAVPLRRPSGRRFGFSLVVRSADHRLPDMVNILLRTECEIYCTPVGDGLMTVALLGERPALAWSRAEEGLASLLEELRVKLGSAWTLSDRARGLGPFGHVCRRSFHGRAILVGDCAETMDPIGGMGMSHALISAGLAGTAIKRVLREGVDPAAAFRRYDRERNAAAQLLRGFTRLTHLTVHHLGPRPVFRRLERSPLPGWVGEALTGGRRTGSVPVRCMRSAMELLGQR